MKDFFQYHEELPQNIQDLLIEFGECGEYNRCNDLIKILAPLGYTCDYGLDGEPFNLFLISEFEAWKVDKIDFILQQLEKPTLKDANSIFNTVIALNEIEELNYFDFFQECASLIIHEFEHKN
jgi:hypothetical protein